MNKKIYNNCIIELYDFKGIVKDYKMNMMSIINHHLR
jgi:hypothetical protein